MEIIEQSIIPKSPTAEPEDGIVTTDDFIAVIDGSTSKSPVRISPKESNGRYCMLLISEYIRQTRSDICVKEFCNGVTAFIRDRYDESRLPYIESHPEERLTASCIIYTRYRNEIWMIGDCQCLVGDNLYENPKPDEAMLASKRASILRKLIKEEGDIDGLRSNDIGRKAIIPEMIETMQNQNVTYSVIDGFPIPMDKVKVISLNDNPQVIVLASDGYPFLKPTFKESEEGLMRQLTTDPLNIHNFLATKAYAKGNNSFDDRTYIRFKTT